MSAFAEKSSVKDASMGSQPPKSPAATPGRPQDDGRWMARLAAALLAEGKPRVFRKRVIVVLAVIGFVLGSAAGATTPPNFGLLGAGMLLCVLACSMGLARYLDGR